MENMFIGALRLMGIGVGTVFAVLAIFFVLIKILMRIFPASSEKEKE